MKTKITLKKALRFVKNCKFIFSLKKNLLQKNIFCLLFCVITTISFAQSGSCNATLIVENNGNIRSTPVEGTYYSMILTNNGASTDTFLLSAKNSNSSCANTDGSPSGTNVSLTADFINSEKSPISELTLNSGQSVNFFLHVSVPIGTPADKWSCNQIIATSKNCTNYSTDTVLHTYVINPVND